MPPFAASRNNTTYRPDNALVLCADEKIQIQTVDRAQPGLPMKEERCSTMMQDYKRHGTTIPFAAFSTLDRVVIGDCMPQPRHQESIRLLKHISTQASPHLDLHLIVDECGTHKHRRVKTWLQRHPRFHLHFTPTSSSWVNLAERWFRDLTQQCLH
jgi:GTPase SAR1 family protein